MDPSVPDYYINFDKEEKSMIKSKHLLIVGLALMLLFTSILAGCQPQVSPSGTGTTNKDSNEPAKTTNENELPFVELSWYTPVGTMPKESDIELVQNELNEYLKDKINAKVTLNFFAMADWKQKSPILIASGDNMDIVFTAGWDGYRKSVTQGAFVDITDLLEKYCPKTLALLPDAYIEGTKVNGRNYCVPVNKDLAHTYGFLYRTDIAEKYGLDFESVKTYSDLTPLFAVIKENEPDHYPVMSAGASTKNSALEHLNFDPIGDATVPGKLYPNRDYKVVNEFDTPEAMALFKVHHEWYKKGYVNPDAPTKKDLSAEWNSGKVYFSKAQGKPFVDEDTTIQRGYPYKYVALTEPFITGNNTQGANHAVYRTSKNVERALMFLELVNTDVFVNNLLNYGVEDVHYVKKGENVIDFAPGLDAKTGYYPNANWIFGNQFLNYFMAGQNTARWEAYREFNNSAVPSKILGFDFNQEPVKTEIAACANVLQEYNAGLNTGALDPEIYLPELVEKLKRAGVDTIIAEKQRQLDEWLKLTGRK